MPPKKRPQPRAAAPFALDSLFTGLGNLIEQLNAAAESAEAGETSRSGTFRIKGLGDQAQGVFGVSIRTGIGGAPRVERFGNIHTAGPEPVVSEVREPLVDLFDEQGEIVLVAELPGVAEAEIVVTISGDLLALETSGERRFAREVLLPHPVAPESLRQTYRNGILELRLQKQP